VKGQSSLKSESRWHLEPLRVIPIERGSNRRVLTRIGIGENRLDHAAGLPLSARASQPRLPVRFPYPTKPFESAPAGRVESVPRRWQTDDAPVVLPMRRSWSTAWTLIAVALVPLGVAANFYFASERPGELPQSAHARVEAVAPQEHTPVATTAPVLADTGTKSQPNAQVPSNHLTSTAVKRPGHAKAKANAKSPLEVRKRAASESPRSRLRAQ
jgi:hypothetical protein